MHFSLTLESVASVCNLEALEFLYWGAVLGWLVTYCVEHSKMSKGEIRAVITGSIETLDHPRTAHKKHSHSWMLLPPSPYSIQSVTIHWRKHRFSLQFFLSDSEETTLPTANTTNANFSVPENQAAILHARNLFFLPVRKLHLLVFCCLPVMFA